MSESAEANLPIGYWLKRADKAITARADEAQRANGVSRVEWQLLNLLRESGRIPAAHAAETMSPFLDGDSFGRTMAHLRELGLIDEKDDALRLTGDGIRRHEEMLAAQMRVRKMTMEGISAEEYATAIRVLRRIVANLEGE